MFQNSFTYAAEFNIAVSFNIFNDFFSIFIEFSDAIADHRLFISGSGEILKETAILNSAA